MKLINPLHLIAALMASVLCLLYGSLPRYGNNTVYFFAANKSYAGYHTVTGACVVIAPCGCMALWEPIKPMPFRNLKTFYRYIKLSHSGALNHD